VLDEIGADLACGWIVFSAILVSPTAQGADGPASESLRHVDNAGRARPAAKEITIANVGRSAVMRPPISANALGPVKGGYLPPGAMGFANGFSHDNFFGTRSAL